MIRVNLLKSIEGSLRTGALVGPQELGIGAILLAAASAVLLYLSLTFKPPARVAPKPAEPAAPAAAVEQPRVVEPPTRAAPPAAPLATVPGSVFRLTGISIQPHAAGLSVLLQVDPHATWRATELREPHRLVVDIPNTRLAVPRPQLTQVIDHPVVRRVRSSQFQQDPAVSRVVLDLGSPARHEIRSGSAGLEILVGDGKR